MVCITKRRMRGNPAETADTAQMFFIVERLADLDSFKKKKKTMTGFNEVPVVQGNFYSKSE